MVLGTCTVERYSITLLNLLWKPPYNEVKGGIGYGGEPIPWRNQFLPRNQCLWIDYYINFLKYHLSRQKNLKFSIEFVQFKADHYNVMVSMFFILHPCSKLGKHHLSQFVFLRKSANAKSPALCICNPRSSQFRRMKYSMYTRMQSNSPADRRLQGDVVYLSWPIAPLVYEPKCGGGGCRVSANENRCAHHVTWSPNKLWRSNYIFNPWPQISNCYLNTVDGIGHKHDGQCRNARARIFELLRSPRIDSK